jgi:hypothetical protein
LLKAETLFRKVAVAPWFSWLLTKSVISEMSEIVEPFLAQNLVNKFSKSLAIISQNHQQKKTEFFRLAATFTKAVSRKTAIQFLALSESNLENCQYQGLLEISRPKSLSMEEIHVFLLLSPKLHISQLILMSMISL